MTNFDYILIALYLLSLIYIGNRSLKKVYNNADYLLSANKFGKVVSGMSFFATDIGGATLVSVPFLIYTKGFVGIYYSLAVIVPLMVLKKYFVKPFRKLHVKTIPELFEKKYNLETRVLVSLLQLGSGFSILLVQVLVATHLIHNIIGLGRLPSLIIATVVFTFYTSIGGIVAVIWTDVFSFIFLAFGLVAAAIVLLINAGGPAEILNVSVQNVSFESLELGTFITYTVLSFGWYMCHQFSTQRLSMTKSAADAKYLYTFSVVQYILLMVLLLTIGFSARAMFPGAETQSIFMKELIINQLPVGIKSLFFVSLLAATMTTNSSVLNASTVIFIIDIYKRVGNTTADNKSCMLVARLFTVCFATIVAITVYFINYSGIYINIIVLLTSSYMSAVLVPMIMSMRGKIYNKKSAFYSIILSITAYFLYYYLGYTVIHPVFIGLGVSLSSMMLLNLRGYAN